MIIYSWVLVVELEDLLDGREESLVVVQRLLHKKLTRLQPTGNYLF
jgi:hypothetical protein